MYNIYELPWIPGWTLRVKGIGHAPLCAVTRSFKFVNLNSEFAVRTQAHTLAHIPFAGARPLITVLN